MPFYLIVYNFTILSWGWGLGIGDWAQSPIPNPQSPIPNKRIFELILLNNIIYSN